MVSNLDEASLALKSSVAAQRREAAQYLASHPNPAACEALLAALDDPDSQAHEAIIRAIVQQSSPEVVARLVMVLREEHPGRRNAALSTLIEMGARKPYALMAALRHPSPEVRLHVAEVLGDLREERATPALIERLSEPTEFPNVRHAAAQALGKIGHRQAVPALLAAAQQGDFWVRYAAVEALGKIGDESAVDPLQALLPTDVWTRPAIVAALGNIGHMSAIDALVTALEDANPAVSAAAVEALTKIIIEPETPHPPDKDKSSEIRRLIPPAPLLRHLNAHQPPISAHAAHLLGWLTKAEALPHLIAALAVEDNMLTNAVSEAILRYEQAALPTLMEALASSPQPRIRENAAELLGMLGNAEAATVLAECLDDADNAVRQAALRALGSLGGDAAHRGLLKALDDPQVRDTAMGVLSQLRDTDLIDDLQLYVYEGKPTTRWAAMQALSLLGTERAVNILLNAMRLPDDVIRLPAGEALARLRSQRAVPALIEALGDRDSLIRQKAVEALGGICHSRGMTALLTLTRDPDWRVRRALVFALANIGEARLNESLRLLAQDPDHWVRRAVMDVCGCLSQINPAELLLHGLDDGEESVIQAALISVGRRREQAAAEAIVACLKHSSAMVRAAAVRALTLLDDRHTALHIGQLAHDPDAGVRREVADALGEVGGEEALAPLETLLGDKAPMVRQRAAESLAHIGSPRAVQVLVAALVHPPAHIAAQSQLTTMGDQALRALLSTARNKEAEEKLRVAAIQALSHLQNPQALHSLKHLAQNAHQENGVRQAAEEAIRKIEAV